MVWYDFVVLALLIYTAWSGAQRGLVTQMAWIAALVLCFKFADKLAPIIEPQINVEQPLRHWIAMFVLYVGFSLGSFMVARILTSWMEQAKLKDFDRHLGGLFGLVKGVVIALVATFFAVTLSETLKTTVLQSKTGYAACAILDSVEPITPEYFHEYLAKYREELKSIHDGHEHLGNGSSSIPWDDHAGVGDHPGGQGDGPDLSGFLTGILGGGETDPSTPDAGAAVSDGPSFEEMWRSLPTDIKNQFGGELKRQWDSATRTQQEKLTGDLNRAFNHELPDVMSRFLRSSGSGSPQQGTATAGDLLNQIGDIYQDRHSIRQRTQEYFAGVPTKVQEAVLRDWHADLNMQSDPDPATDIRSKLDERILRQLDKAGVSFNRLSLNLRNRLNESRR